MYRFLYKTPRTLVRLTSSLVMFLTFHSYLLDKRCLSFRQQSALTTILVFSLFTITICSTIFRISCTYDSYTMYKALQQSLSLLNSLTDLSYFLSLDTRSFPCSLVFIPILTLFYSGVDQSSVNFALLSHKLFQFHFIIQDSIHRNLNNRLRFFNFALTQSYQNIVCPHTTIHLIHNSR